MKKGNKSEILQISKKVMLKLDKLAERNIFPQSLDGACGLASIWLKNELSLNKIKANVMHTGIGTHIWVQTKDFLIDLTSQQFDKSNPKILILELGSKKYDKYLQKLRQDLMNSKINKTSPNQIKKFLACYDFVPKI